MILNVSDALKTYLESRMVRITGSGNKTIPIYTDVWPSECKAVAVMITRSPGGGGDEVDAIDHATIRVWCRATKSQQAYKLAQNVDALLHNLYDHNLDKDVRCLGLFRSTGPDRIDSEDNNLKRYTSLYDGMFIEVG